MGSTDDDAPRVPQEPEPESTPRQLLLDEARQLLTISDSYVFEVEQFLDMLAARVKDPQTTGVPAFLRTAQREREAMERAADELGAAERPLDAAALAQHRRRIETSAAAIRHGATHWAVLKRCRSLKAVGQAFQGSSRDARRSQVAQTRGSGRQKQQLHRTLKEQSRVEVDVVEGGSEWIDVRWLHADRLARQMADCGWGWGEHAAGEAVDPAEWLETPLARQVARVVAAARLHRHDYRVPRVRVVLPNLRRGASPDVDALLDQLTRLHPGVRVVIDDAAGGFLAAPCPPLPDALARLLPDDDDDEAARRLTPTLNMDHTVLVDLASDLTHARLRPEPWQDRTTRAQIAEENAHAHAGGLMARSLYPVLGGRLLVCTREAAAHFHAVLDAVGTPTEKLRGRLLVPHPDEPAAAETGDDVRRRFQELSVHALPPSVQLPVRVLARPWGPAAVEAAVARGELPRVALDVARCAAFKSAKLSIYMSGWAGGVTTVTSNKEISGQMRTWVEANRRDDDEAGPAIWRVDVTRNLLAKNAKMPEKELASR